MGTELRSILKMGINRVGFSKSQLFLNQLSRLTRNSNSFSEAAGLSFG